MMVDTHNLAKYDHPTLVKRYNECIDDYRRKDRELVELSKKIDQQIQEKNQLLHPWSCYRDENGDIVLMYEGIDQSVYLRGITKQQVDSLREELKSFELLDMESNQDLR